MKILLVLCNKGGVAKTTLARTLICEMARAGLNVIGVDADPQGTLTHTMGVIPQPGLYNWIARYRSIELRDVVVGVSPTIYGGQAQGGAWLIPSDWETSNVHKAPVSPLIIRHQLIRAADQYALDVAVIDPPPSESELHPWLLHAADFVIVPAECTEECFNEQYGAVANTLRYMANHRDTRVGAGLPESKLIGIQPVKWEPGGGGLVSKKAFYNMAQEWYKELLWQPIETRKDWGEAVMVKKSITQYAPDSPAARQAEEFTYRVLEGIGMVERDHVVS
jgi:cellulose biosynthesis protein BcsQ